MILTADALAHLFALVTPLSTETVPLRHAAGRTLSQDVTATRDQPPFAASAMDGYAVRAMDVAAGAAFAVIGEAAAGHGFAGAVGAGQATRIFTGAPLPQGANRVLIQEDVTRQADTITLNAAYDQSAYVRPAGADFKAGDKIAAPRLISPSDVALLAAMNAAQVPVTRKPVVAIIATGDELVQPGETPSADQIIASNSYGLAALIDANGGHARLMPIAKDTVPALELAFDLARSADLIVTIGGASVGDHDLVGQVALDQGMDRAFYKVAMRPGKAAYGRHNQRHPDDWSARKPCLCNGLRAHLYVARCCARCSGIRQPQPPRDQLPRLSHSLSPNGPREHYMRARLSTGMVCMSSTAKTVHFLTVLAEANCLAVRPPKDRAAPAG